MFPFFWIQLNVCLGEGKRRLAGPCPLPLNTKGPSMTSSQHRPVTVQMSSYWVSGKVTTHIWLSSSTVIVCWRSPPLVPPSSAGWQVCRLRLFVRDFREHRLTRGCGVNHSLSGLQIWCFDTKGGGVLNPPSPPLPVSQVKKKNSFLQICLLVYRSMF